MTTEQGEMPKKKENKISAFEMNARKQGAVPEGYRTIEVDWFEFKEQGDELCGRLLRKDSINVKTGGKVGKYTIQVESGKKVAFLGSVQLDELMYNVGLGAQVIITMIGTQQLDEFKTMKRFIVYTK